MFIVNTPQSAGEIGYGLSRWIAPSKVTWSYQAGWRRVVMPANRSGCLSDLKVRVVVCNYRFGQLVKGEQTISLHAIRPDNYPVETGTAPKWREHRESNPDIPVNSRMLYL